MLKHLTKYFKPAVAEQLEKVEEMTTQETQATLAADETATAELIAQLATATEALAAAQGQLAEMSTKYEAVQAALNASEDAKKEFAAQAAAKRLEVRTSALAAAMGKDNKALATMLAATDALDDKQFNDVASAMSTNFETEAKSTMFQETGVAASVDASKVQEESTEMKNLKAKYQKSK